MTPALPVLDLNDPRTRSHHLLALPPDVEPAELEALAVSRFGAVAWEPVETAAPRTGILPAVTSAFGIRAVGDRPAPVSRLRIGRQSGLVGPSALVDPVALGLPAYCDQVWVVETPRERGEPPFAGGGDRDGLRRAFGAGLPVREEERVVRWLIASARRVGGAVRTADDGVVLIPDPEAAVDLTLYTTAQPTPEELLAQVRRVLPRATPPVDGGWRGPLVERAPTGRHSRVRPQPQTGALAALRETLDLHGVSDEQERHRLVAEAAAYDEAMAGRRRSTVFGVLADLDLDGFVEVVSEQLEAPPLVLREVTWASMGLVALRVRWHAVDPEQQQAEHPSALHRVARGRAAPLVNDVAVRLWEAFGGEIADEAEFLIHPDDLRPTL
ncbi:MAG: hypothetical protein KJ792_11015 [Actinobacteria bacterium]|nr:hypothetical protein [Actinomycetota bacterium]